MAKLLKGTAFITGAASALQFAAAGVQRLVLADINADALAAVVALLREQHADVEVMSLELDAAAVKAGLEGAQQRFGRIDIAVNNAGTSGSGKPTHQLEEAEWLGLTDILLNGVWRCQKEELAIMVEQEIPSSSPREGRGCIINVASIYGLVAHDTAVAYTAAKHGKQHTAEVFLKGHPQADHEGVVGLTRADALRYGPQGIRINAIAPGFTETPLLTNPMRRDPATAAALTVNIEMAPMGRMATVEEIADCIVFLASPMSSFVHGSVLVADGGYTAG
ncbi:3-oxoacyl- reductase [Apiospora rasikravindrae]|uniref:3-oxoacyl- reductase n=1 Tax=Apiospora rasikravindrae TaxID=990691 RepID=A0ABR1SJV6_9PEZI